MKKGIFRSDPNKDIIVTIEITRDMSRDEFDQVLDQVMTVGMNVDVMSGYLLGQKKEI